MHTPQRLTHPTHPFNIKPPTLNTLSNHLPTPPYPLSSSPLPPYSLTAVWWPPIVSTNSKTSPTSPSHPPSYPSLPFPYLSTAVWWPLIVSTNSKTSPTSTAAVCGGLPLCPWYLPTYPSMSYPDPLYIHARKVYIPLSTTLS